MVKRLSTILRDRIIIEQPVTTPDGQGGFTKAWETVDCVWAKLDSQSGTEAAKDRQIADQSRFRITIRHRRDVTHAMRICWNENYYAILSVSDPDGTKQSLVMLVERGE